MVQLAFRHLDRYTSSIISSLSHSARHPIQSKIRLTKRHQLPPANDQPPHERIQTPPVRSHNVQKYSPIRGHVNCCQCKSVTNYQYSTTNSSPDIIPHLVFPSLSAKTRVSPCGRFIHPPIPISLRPPTSSTFRKRMGLTAFTNFLAQSGNAL